jgi:diguanylate cyclase (GGDEF)-like protein
MRLAQIFIKNFDTDETIARYGGDEFIILCPGIKKTDAARIVGHLLQELKKYDFASGKKKATVTFSAGVSSYPDDAITATELIRLADHALYAAKKSGRNMVRVYDPKIVKP